MNQSSTQQKFDLVVIGGGPGGYVAAIRGALRGLSVALIESGTLGGTCLNRGCIPSKSLIANAEVLHKVKNAQKYGIHVEGFSFDYSLMKEGKDRVVERLRKGLEGLIASHRVKLFRGYGKLLSPFEVSVTGDQEALLQAKYIILATGSEPRELPGMAFDYNTIHDSTSLLELTSLPKSLLIVGGGVIGCEFASLHQELGVEVTILELLPTILSTESKVIADALTQSFKRRGIKVETGVSIVRLEKRPDGVVAHLNDGRTFSAEQALVSVGRKYNTDGIGLEKAGVIVEKNGTILTNEHLQTNISHIYAIGDITGKWLLAHAASHQGIVAADDAAGFPSHIDYNAVPSVIFTHPEIASVGLTLEKALQQGINAVVGKFPFQALGRSLASQETEGFVQVVIEKESKRVLGAQVIGAGASILIGEMTLAVQNELTVECIFETMHAHPTTSEAWLEAALFAVDLPLHLPPKKQASGA